MSRSYHPYTIAILKYLSRRAEDTMSQTRGSCCPSLSAKDFYNYVFRLLKQELIEKTGSKIKITEDGRSLLGRLAPERDGVWKLVIFDIPEKYKYVRSVLRNKLKQLHFKKWQNSIWVTPFALDKEIEQELADLGKKYFVRLIKTADINNTQDLEKMFP
jgi:predicted transcriptional regulator